MSRMPLFSLLLVTAILAPAATAFAQETAAQPASPAVAAAPAKPPQVRLSPQERVDRAKNWQEHWKKMTPEQKKAFQENRRKAMEEYRAARNEQSKTGVQDKPTMQNRQEAIEAVKEDARANRMGRPPIAKPRDSSDSAAPPQEGAPAQP